MQNSTRVIVNTFAQYTRTIINIALSFYSTRLILGALGVNDYGIFTLIAGVVAMLSFMTAAMVTTTQRFMSYHQTKSNLQMQKVVFGNSVILHAIFAIVILIILEAISGFLFDGFLNIQPERIEAAKKVYQCVIFMLIVSFMTAPYKSLLISHENIVYTSSIEVLDGVARVIIAIILTHLSYDKLILYGILMLCVSLFDFLAFAIYDFVKYAECVIPKLKWFNRTYIKSMSSFIGWQLYSTGCIIGRTQGTAIILNKIYGTAINASFGIAQQISGGISFISSSLMTAINPQIVKAEGSGDRQRMLRLSETASKFSTLLMALLVIPICFVLPQLLEAWLGTVPDYSVLFCKVILITALLDQISMGLGSANQAIGNIGRYSIVVNTIKLLTLPILLILLEIGVSLRIAIWSYAAIELICALCRIPFLKYNGGLNIGKYIKNVFLRLPIPIIYLLIISYILKLFGMSLIYYILFCVPMALGYLFIVYYTALTKDETKICQPLFVTIKNKIKL